MTLLVTEPPGFTPEEPRKHEEEGKIFKPEKLAGTRHNKDIPTACLSQVQILLPKNVVSPHLV